MEYASESVEKLVEAFSALPGIGKKSAQRVALYLLQEGKDQGRQLIQAITDLNEKVRHCSVCFNLTEQDPCSFCQDPKRDHHTICVVEDPKDLLAIESAGGFHGLYHVLGGVLSPLDGVGEEQLHIRELMDRLDSEISEIIIATNPTVEGEMTAAHLAKKLQGRGIKLSRIARGIPFGGALDFNDAVTVAKSIEGRIEMT